MKTNPKFPFQNLQTAVHLNLKSNKYTDNGNTELQTELKLPTNEKEDMKKSDMENPNQSKNLSIIKDNTINTNMTDSSKLPSETSNTHLIKSDNLQQHTNTTISSVQETISASHAKQNEIIPQNIPQRKKIRLTHKRLLLPFR